MRLPVMPPVKPMLAKAIPAMPEGEDGELLFEPKWDGFRCIVFRDGDEVELGSRNERPLTRYFPELLDPLRTSLPGRCVVDGEIVVEGPDGLDFDALQQRIHPAASRIDRLAGETPAAFVAFDLLALDDRSLMEEPFAERRRLLADLLADSPPPVHLTPSTSERATAEDWFTRFEGAGLDGVIAKPAAGTYVQDKRVQFKIKHQRTADCVVAGFRRHKDGEGVGSLLLGLFDDEGHLHHMGVASSFTAARRRELVDELAPFEASDLSDHPWGSGPRPAPTPRRPAGACRVRPPAGTTPRTCPSCRCVSSWWPRWPTNGSTRAASATAPGCCAGAPTARRHRARSTSSKPRPRWAWRSSSTRDPTWSPSA
ncbi:MAG: ATP-dependent DNA ligase [Acidimicrobiales bacterium]